MTGLRRNYKLAKKEILTLWEAEFPSRPPFSYVATRELLRRDAGIATSRRRKMGIERGKEQAMESPGTGAQRRHGERAWVRILIGQKVKRSKVTFDKSEKVKVKRWILNEMNGERGELGERGERGIWWICRICECDFSKNRNETNPKYHITIIKYQDY